MTLSIADDCAAPSFDDIRAAGERPPTPTLDEIRTWPATVSVPRACTAIGISRSHGYELVKVGEFPFRVLQLRGRSVVVTTSIVEVLAGGSEIA